MTEVPIHINPNELGKIDPNELTLEELKSGRFGFTDDIEAISDPELKEFMGKVRSYFDAARSYEGSFYVADLYNKFGSEFSTQPGNIRQQLDPLRGAMHLNLSKTKDKVHVGERIELEAAMAFLKTRQMILHSKGKKRADIDEIIAATINNLGNYYAVVPLFTRESFPEYLKKPPVSDEKDNNEKEKIKKILTEEEKRDGKKNLVESYIPSVDVETETELKTYNPEFIVHKIDMVGAEMGEISDLEGVNGSISWEKFNIGWGTRRVLEFILRANNHELYKYDKREIGITLKEFHEVLLIAHRCFTEDRRITDLNVLYQLFSHFVRKDPEKFLGTRPVNAQINLSSYIVNLKPQT